jgi:hypothetical protein
VLQTLVNIAPDAIRAQLQKAEKLEGNLYNITKHMLKTHGMQAFTSALPHKLTLGMIDFTSKSLLRTFWNEDILPYEYNPISSILDSNTTNNYIKLIGDIDSIIKLNCSI